MGIVPRAASGQTRRKAGTQSHRSTARSYDSGVTSEAQASCRRSLCGECPFGDLSLGCPVRTCKGRCWIRPLFRSALQSRGATQVDMASDQPEQLDRRGDAAFPGAGASFDAAEPRDGGRRMNMVLLFRRRGELRNLPDCGKVPLRLHVANDGIGKPSSTSQAPASQARLFSSALETSREAEVLGVWTAAYHRHQVACSDTGQKLRINHT